MKIEVDVLERYLLERYQNWKNEQGLFLKLVEEMGEVAEIINMRVGNKKPDDNVDLQKELGTELADMIARGEIIDGKTQSAVMKAMYMRNKGEQK